MALIEKILKKQAKMDNLDQDIYLPGFVPNPINYFSFYVMYLS